MCPVNDRVKIKVFLCHVSSSAQQRILLLSYAACSRAVQPTHSFRSFCAFSFVSFYPVRHAAAGFRILSRRIPHPIPQDSAPYPAGFRTPSHRIHLGRDLCGLFVPGEHFL